MARFFTEENLVAFIDYLSDEFNLYLSLMILIFGIIGNIFNCFVLRQKKLRHNPCAFYFLSSSIISLISICFGLPSKILASWHRDPTDTNDFLCKLRAFIVFASRTMSIWIIMFATIDRAFLSSRNANLRKYNNLKITKLSILISFYVSVFSYTHMFNCYKANLNGTPLKCYSQTKMCHLTTNLVYVFITILIPLIIMSIFSFLIITNIRELRQRAHQTIMFGRNQLMRRTDQNLLRMLFVQVFFLMSFCIPQALHKFYITFQLPAHKHDWRDALNKLFYNIDVLLAFITNAMPFYLYTLTGGTVFRKAFLNCIESIQEKFYHC